VLLLGEAVGGVRVLEKEGVGLWLWLLDGVVVLEKEGVGLWLLDGVGVLDTLGEGLGVGNASSITMPSMAGLTELSPMLAVDPDPKRPSPPNPKQISLPSDSTAHVSVKPAETLTTARPVSTGTMPLMAGLAELSPILAVDPDPKRPLLPDPKQISLPSDSTAHVCAKPAETLTTLRPASTGTMPLMAGLAGM
jgi:hypothetical protein